MKSHGITSTFHNPGSWAAFSAASAGYLESSDGCCFFEFRVNHRKSTFPNTTSNYFSLMLFLHLQFLLCTRYSSHNMKKAAFLPLYKNGAAARRPHAPKPTTYIYVLYAACGLVLVIRLAIISKIPTISCGR